MRQTSIKPIGFAVWLLFLAGAVPLSGEERTARPSNPDKTAGEESDVIRERIRLYLQRHGDNGRIDPQRRLKAVAADYALRRVEEASRFLSPQDIGAGNWISLGPTNGAGRVTAIAPHPTQMGAIYIGTADGGVWKTADGGVTWTPLTDGINDLSVGAFAIAPSSPNILYLGSGEGGYATDFIPGIGLLTSTDGGSTWALPSSVFATTFYRISVHPTNPQELVVGTNQGALRSIDGGASWRTVITRIFYGDVADIVRHPAEPRTLYAATWCAQSCSAGVSKVLKSIDGGVTWVEKSAGLPTAPQSSSFRLNERIALAISPSNPLFLYAATGQTDSSGDVVSHIYKTTDGGDSWADLTALSTASSTRISHYLRAQSWYDNTIVVSPSDPNVFFAGGTNYVRSTDGGTTFSFPSLNGNVHVDAHDLQYQGTTLYIGNDGGVWSSSDDGQTASARNTDLVIRQFYALANDPVNRNRVLAGSQDNGTNQRQDAGGTTWRTVIGADGFECAVNTLVPGVAYGTAQNGRVARSKNAGGSDPRFTGVVPFYGDDETTPFLSVLTVHPKDPSVLFTASYRVWRSDNGGDSWVPLPTTTTDGSVWSTARSITAIAVSRTEGAILMVSKRDGSVFRSKDGGKTWVSAANGLPGYVINNLEIDPRDPAVAYAAIATTSGSNLYRTTDGGSTWSPRAVGLPSFATQVVRVDHSDSNVLYCGTDVGIYRSADQGGSWEKLGTGLPNSSVQDIGILEDGSILRVATHGRGVWEIEMPPSGNTPPSAAIASPSADVTVAKGATVKFSGSVSDADSGDTAAGTWTFSDTWETVSAGSGTSSVSHVFTRPGVYPVTLTARDTRGALGSTSVLVSVAEPGDGCATPIAIPGAGPFPCSTFANSEAATIEPSDPFFFSCVAIPWASVWFEFTPTASGMYELSTCGTPVDTVLAVFTGPACGPYTEVTGGCNDEASSGAACRGEGPSLVKIQGNAGETLRIMVTGFSSSSVGNFSLTVRPADASDATPRVTGASRPASPSAGGTTLTVSGEAFAEGASVTVGGIPATSVSFVDSHNLTIAVPAHGAGPVDIVVANPDGSSGRLIGAFTYTPLPETPITPREPITRVPPRRPIRAH